MSPPEKRWSVVSWLILVSLTWAGFGLGLACATPWLGFLSSDLLTPLHLAAPLITGLFLLACLVVAVRLVGRTGRIVSALPLTLTQILLFQLLFVQIAFHLGTHHYAWDGPPAAYDWPWFVAAHAVRVGDVVDVIEPFGLRIQPIHHASPLTAGCLVAFHLITGVFLIGMVAEWLDGLRRGVLHDFRRAGQIVLGVVGIIVLIFMISIPLQAKEFMNSDYLLYLFDNALHTLDFGDLMETYHVRLYRPDLPFVGGYLFFLRLGFAALLGGLLVWVRPYLLLGLFGGWGMSRVELEEVAQKHRSSWLRSRAARRLKTFAEVNSSTPQGSPGWGALFVGLIVMALVASPALGAATWNWGLVVNDLAGRAIDFDHPNCSSARETLGRMGPYASAAAPVLAGSLDEASADRQRAILTTLGQFGPASRDHLEKFLTTADPEKVVWVVQSARALRLEGVPLLMKAGELSHDQVRSACRNGLRDLGYVAQEEMIKYLNVKNARLCLEALDEINPNWPTRPPDSWHFPFHAAAEHRAALRVVWDPTSSDEALATALEELVRNREATAFAVPDFLRLLKHPNDKVRSAAARASCCCPDVTHGVALELAAMVADDEPAIRSRAVEVLGCLRSVPPGVIPVLGPLLKLSDEGKRRAAVLALCGVHPMPAEGVSILIPFLSDADREVSQAVVRGLARAGPTAAPAVPALTRILDEGKTLNYVVVETLVAIGPDASPAIPVLKRWLQEEIRYKERMSQPGAPQGYSGNGARDPVAFLTESLDRINKFWRLP